MANITISDLQQIETQVSKLSTLELGTIMGGKPKYSVELGLSQTKGAYVAFKIIF